MEDHRNPQKLAQPLPNSQHFKSQDHGMPNPSDLRPVRDLDLAAFIIGGGVALSDVTEDARGTVLFWFPASVVEAKQGELDSGASVSVLVHSSIIRRLHRDYISVNGRQALRSRLRQAQDREAITA